MKRLSLKLILSNNICNTTIFTGLLFLSISGTLSYFSVDIQSDDVAPQFERLDF